MRPAAPPGSAPATAGGTEEATIRVSTPGETSDPSAGPPRRDRGRWLLRALIALLSLVVLGGAVAFVVLQRNKPATGAAGGISSPSPNSPFQAFAFRLGPVTAVPVTRGTATQAARTVAMGIQSSLTTFYQAAFVDPSAWTGDISQQAWGAFASSVKGRAMADRAALTVGRHDGVFTEVTVFGNALAVRVLLDPAGHPQAALADVTFGATAVLNGVEQVQVTNSARFLFRPLGGSWRIVGYPRASTNVTGPVVPSPSPSPGLSLTPSPAPAGASP
jgi:hypothetical protein